MSHDRKLQESIDKRSAAVMKLEANHRKAVLALIAVRAYLTGAHNLDEITSKSERIDLALAEIEKVLPTL